MAVKGGQPGNQNSSMDKRMVADMLRKVAKQNPKRLRAACAALLARAETGDTTAFTVIADRLDGKLIAPVDVTSNGMTLEQLVAAASEPTKEK